MRFAPMKTTPPGRFRRVPPVIFLPLAGLVILLLAWQQAVAALVLPPGPVELPAGAVAAAGAFAFFAYGAKLVRRPGVLAEDLRILPGRAGIGAALIALSGFAAMLAGIAPGFAMALLVLGLVLHLAYGLVLIAAVMRRPGQGRVSPLWQLDFAGPAAAALAAAMLDWPRLAHLLLWFSLAVMLAVWAASAAQLWRERVGPPLRPLLALHALPPALAGMAAARLDIDVDIRTLPFPVPAPLRVVPAGQHSLAAMDLYLPATRLLLTESEDFADVR